jgi:ABC-type transport system involved in cytochrome c biogenesis permease subunit
MSRSFFQYIAVAAVVFLTSPALFAIDTSGIEDIAIQEGGRKKPFLVFAHETLLGMTGKSSFSKDGRSLNAIFTVTSIWLAPKGWENEPLILINNQKFKSQVGLNPRKKLFAYRELAESGALRTALNEVSNLRSKNPRASLDIIQREVSNIGMRLALFEGLVSGNLVTLLPTAAAAWSPLPTEDPALIELRRGLLQNNQGAFNRGLELLRSEQASEEVRFQADPAKIAIEVAYQKIHPFRWAWILYLVAGILLITIPGSAGYILGWIFSGAGFLLQVSGFVLRILISGRAPVTNMYESVVWVAFGTILFALIFEAIYRSRYFLLGAVPVAVASLILADTQPVILNSAINPLVPVLADNFWLTTHVLSITLSYGAFALALGVGHIILGKTIFGSKASPALNNYLYRTLQVGVLLLAVGTLLGGVWANYSWGRFWDWDPKETWALIALLVYLFLLHGRIAGKWAGFGMAVGAVLAFQSIIMAWYGVNFILGVGLHSYGFGSGGLPGAVAFVSVEFLFVAIAVFRHRFLARKAATA